jgi:hypothetical protein
MFTPLYFAVLNHHKEPQMIQPTIGRVVHYFRHPGAEAQAALIANVNQDGTVNLAIFDHNGNPEARAPFIPLLQEGETIAAGHYCRWMPYQLGQAAKTEAMEARLVGGTYGQATGLRTGEVSFQNENTGFGGVFAAVPVADPIPVLNEVVDQGGTLDGGGASGDWAADCANGAGSNLQPTEAALEEAKAGYADSSLSTLSAESEKQMVQVMAVPTYDSSPSSSEPSSSSSSSD